METPVIDHQKHADEVKVWKLLESVLDPEIPVLSVVDLGIIREVKVNGSDVEVFISPTYMGCPAMDVIGVNIRITLFAEGFKTVKVTQRLSPAWTTEWMSEEGKKKLAEYGIAPPNPVQSTCSPVLFASEEAIECPHCHSYNTRRLSEFGSTACKSLYQCNSCSEPFDYFKCH